jgi:hypothetical protein
MNGKEYGRNRLLPNLRYHLGIFLQRLMKTVKELQSG